MPNPNETPQQRGRRARKKGNRVENALVKRHKRIGVFAERTPLSGQLGYRGCKEDIDVYAWGQEEPPLTIEAKGRKNGEGFKTIERWLGEAADGLFLKRDYAQPLVVLTWESWEKLLFSAKPATADADGEPTETG